MSCNENISRIMKMSELFMQHRRSHSLSTRDVQFAVRALFLEELTEFGRKAVMRYVGLDSTFSKELKAFRKEMRTYLDPTIRIRKTAVVYLYATIYKNI